MISKCLDVHSEHIYIDLKNLIHMVYDDTEYHNNNFSDIKMIE
jgi:hypothetical protein